MKKQQSSPIANPEKDRLYSNTDKPKNWKRWGPYLTERQWGTVREDYSPYGNAWEFISHDMARSKAYRWGEEGMAGISDDNQLLCFAIALWNGKDPILKERLFGVTGNEGNHGEDVKELYYYLDSTPTHSYMKMLYKYPQQAFPYQWLVEENKSRGRQQPEFDLLDTGIMDNDAYFDVFTEYAKDDENDLLIRITVFNRHAEAADLTLLPQLWFRNTWAWGHDDYKPQLTAQNGNITATHRDLPALTLYCNNEPELLFCDNETNTERLYQSANATAFVKDGIHDFVVNGREKAVNPQQTGTKAAARYQLHVEGQGSAVVVLRLSDKNPTQPFADFEAIFETRKNEADAFYADIQQHIADEDARAVQRQAFAGMLWSKQYYYLDIPQWLNGDPAGMPPPENRKKGRNHEWVHLNNADIISMPDKWEYPWYAAWDLAFHCIPLAMLDCTFAKNQLLLLTKEWYMHPNGQLPAYEWAFGDVNPPVHGYATWKVYEMEKKQTGKGDRRFLESVFHKLMLNFNWWVNRKDADGHNVFQGGFLGLDNIGVFDRSAELPTGGHIEQADGTSWMAMYSLNLLRIALELSKENDVYEDMATKLFEHFLYIAGAMNNIGTDGLCLWDEEDGFFYDVLHTHNGHHTNIPLKVRSMVGLIPLYAVEVLDGEMLDMFPEFFRRLKWFLDYRPDLSDLVARWMTKGKSDTHLLSLLREDRIRKVLQKMLDESEFLSDYGIRALSKYHAENPYRFQVGEQEFRVDYTPAESETHLFGGNSNWRGPIWFPVNFLLIESLKKFHTFFGDSLKVECPAGSGQEITLGEAALEISRRLTAIFLRNENGERPCLAIHSKQSQDPHFKDYPLFYEYFHGDNGRGVGASHQTGWTGLVAYLIQYSANPEHV